LNEFSDDEKILDSEFFTDKMTLIQRKLAWFIAACLHFLRPDNCMFLHLQRIFYGRFFTVKELIQTPIGKTAPKNT
jgi:hypothetical protein